jgi:hypothetical protein
MTPPSFLLDRTAREAKAIAGRKYSGQRAFYERHHLTKKLMDTKFVPLKSQYP